jgi:hypothetical protein
MYCGMVYDFTVGLGFTLRDVRLYLFGIAGRVGSLNEENKLAGSRKQ